MQNSIFSGLRKMKGMLVAVLIACVSCNSVFYQGDSVSGTKPELLHISCTREYIESFDKTRLQTMYCPAEQESKPRALVVQFHGNAQNMYTHYRFLAWLLKKGYSLATFDYRGYGDSDGESSRDGIAGDARAYIRYMRAHYPSEQRVFYGQSLGGIILMRALLDEGMRSDEVYIFEGTFASYQSEARSALANKWFLWPLQWLAYVLVTDSHAVDGELEKFEHQNVLIIHGEKDPVVALRHGQFLSDNMRQPLWQIPNGKHLDSWFIEHGRHRDEFLQKLAAILSRRPSR